MIIKRQKIFSTNWLNIATSICPICDNKCDIYIENNSNYPESVFKQVLKDWKTNIVEEVYNYEKNYTNITEKDLEKRLRIFGIGFWNNSSGTILEIQVEPTKELKSKYFGDLYWAILFNSKGNLVDISAND